MRPRLGIDIGGTNIRGVLWDGRRVIAAAAVPTPRTPGRFRRSLRALAARLAAASPAPARAVGIGAAGAVQGTRILSSRNIPYLKAFDFRSAIPVGLLRLDNDARAFARAERALGAGRGAKRMLAFTVGTGIGRAYVAEGAPKRLKRFERAEFWEREYQALRAGADDRALAEFLGRRLAAIAARYPADVIVIGGGILGRRRFFPRLASAMRRAGARPRISRSRLGDYAGAIGAALLFGNT